MQEWIEAGFTDWPQFVRVDFDWCADPVWDEGGALLTIECFAISPSLRAEFQAWQDRFDNRPIKMEFEPPEVARFRDAAIELGRRLKQEIPRCLVVADDVRVRADGSLGERVPWPGEGFGSAHVDRGAPFQQWKQAVLNGAYPD